jgi:hypothetical protein
MPTPARGDCGDYIIMGPRLNGKVAKSSTASDALHPSHHRSDQHNPFAPCSGPNCSRRSVPPAPVPVNSGQVRADNWGLVILGPQHIEVEFRAAITGEANSPPVRVSSSIYHPPRQGFPFLFV